MNIIYGLVTFLVLAIVITLPFLLAYFIYRLVKGQKKQTGQAQHTHHQVKTSNAEADYQRWKAERESREG